MSKFNKFCFGVYAFCIFFSIYAVPAAILKIIAFFTGEKEFNNGLFILMAIVACGFILKGSRVHEERIRERTILEIEEKYKRNNMQF